MKNSQSYLVFKDGLNFDDYPDFQPKITQPKHFSPQCNVSVNIVHFAFYGTPFPLKRIT